MKLILITRTEIIKKIFLLVCKKLAINLIIQDNLIINHRVDFIIVDEEFINDDFNSLKQYTKKLVAITSEELPFEKSRDFIINRPFLPASLEEVLAQQCEFIKEENIDEKEVSTNYVESLVDDIALNIEKENDGSIVSISSLNQGGVLDFNELNRITNILHNDNVQNKISSVDEDENDWEDISEIIDSALNEIEDYEFKVEKDQKKPIKVLLNNYNISELKPFLQKFDKSVIDKLSSGKDVDITLCLKVNK